MTFVTMFAIPFVEVKVTKGLGRIFGRRRSRPSTTLAFPFAMTLWIAGWENWGPGLPLGAGALGFPVLPSFGVGVGAAGFGAGVVGLPRLV